MYVASGLMLQMILEQVGMAVQVGNQNAVQLTRANIRLDALEQKLSAPGSDTSVSTFNDSEVLDASALQELPTDDLVGMIPCDSEVQLETLEHALKDSNSRQWMVRERIYQCYVILLKKDMYLYTNVRHKCD